MSNEKLSLVEKIVLSLVFFIVLVGYYFFYSDFEKFELFIREDGIAEWLTVVGLILGSAVCFSRFFRLMRKRTKWFLVVTFGLGLFLFFAAGEEISWGQRIFGIATPEYFQKNNAQQETNLHNLVVGGVKINKLFFSLILVGLLTVFLLVVPLIYSKNNTIKKLLDKSAVPVPQWYQVIAFLILFGLTSLIKHGKNAELLECGGALLFYILVRYPKNELVFRSN